MRAQIITAQPFEFASILDVSIQKGANTHGRARIRGYIHEDMQDRYVSMSMSDTPVIIEASDFEGNRKPLFQGFLEDMRISVDSGQKVMELLVMPFSRLLDIKPEIRVFQNLSLTYNDLVGAVLSPFGDDAYAIINAGHKQAIGEMFVQYQETAWSFLMRMASMKNDVIVPNDTRGGIKLYFGFPKNVASDAPPLKPISFDVMKNVGGYIYKRDNKVLSINENDSVSVSSPNGSIVMIGGETVTIEQNDAMVELNEENVAFKGAQIRTD